MMELINSDFYKLDGNLSDKLDFYLDHLELLRLIYLNQYITFITKRSYSTRMKGSLGMCEKNILKKISKINCLIKRSTENELKNALTKIKIFEKIVEKIQEDIPTFNNKLLKTKVDNKNVNIDIIDDNGNNLTKNNNINSSQILLNQRSSFQMNEQKKMRRLEELRRLNSDMTILKEMFIDLQQITAEQEPIIDNILENVDDSNINTEHAVVELRHAQNYQVNMFGYKLALVGGVCGALVGAPVGFAIIGTKVAIGVGAATCGVVGLFSGNRVSEGFREDLPESSSEN